MAPTGQIGTIGQRWFCGQASGLIVSAMILYFCYDAKIGCK